MRYQCNVSVVVDDKRHYRDCVVDADDMSDALEQLFRDVPEPSTDVTNKFTINVSVIRLKDGV